MPANKKFKPVILETPQSHAALRGRGASWSPANRFEKLHVDLTDPDVVDVGCETEETPRRPTQYFRDGTRTIINCNDSPDVGFSASINPYRGCEHGCIYCYARPFHEYLGFSSGLDFETKIMVKTNAPRLLREELASPKWKPQVIGMSGVTDCYQPVERRLKLTRGCLEVLAECRNPVAIITKNLLVTRDIDLLAELARHRAVAVFISLTTLDTELRKLMEPRTSPPAARLRAVEALSQAGIPVGVLIAPVIPGLNDHEIPSLVETAANAGARSAGHVMLRLPHAVAPLFEQWLATHFPDRKEKVLNRVRAMRHGKLYESAFGQRMSGEGIFADQIQSLFEVACRKHGIGGDRHELSTAAFRRPATAQLEMSLENR